MSLRKTTGDQGEHIAAAYLQKHGYEIVAQNWRWALGEIDIVARQDDVLVFVEVRTRRRPTTEQAFASISPRKQARMIQSVYAYLEAHSIDEEAQWRIDVIGVGLNGGEPIVEHVEDALDW